jgi:gamma-glutamyltranspeptidase/glutathione hydrolase
MPAWWSVDRCLRAITAAVLLLAGWRPACAAEPRGDRGIVATAHPLATQAALDAFAAGGNAIDAAVAACVTLGVVDPANSGLGGGCFMLLVLADGRSLVLDGRETAPAAARETMFVRDGVADTAASTVGPLASGVPGALAVYADAVRRFGRRSLGDALRPAATLAAEGFAIDAALARRVAKEADALRQFPASRAVWLHANGRPLAAGDRLVQDDLAASYRQIAAEGSDWFYRGGFASAVGAWMEAHGGVLTAADFAGYELVEREPLATTYHGFTILLPPPPSSGGVHIAQMLRMLEGFDLATIEEPGLREHLLAESMKLAFADRAFWLGDPAFTPVPRGLVDEAYCARLATAIDPARAAVVAGPGTPPAADTAVFGAGKHTTHVSVADAEGNWVAVTATLNTWFGSKVIVPGTGLLLNNEMDDFSIQPGVGNAFGLVGGAANAVAAGKRPLSSMSPTIVLRDGRPMIALGGAGGPTIISQTLQHLVLMLDLGASPAAAVAAPRLHHQWRPDRLAVEPDIPPAVRAALVARGHVLDERRSIGVSQIVARDDDGEFTGASDPREGGGAAGGW